MDWPSSAGNKHAMRCAQQALFQFAVLLCDCRNHLARHCTSATLLFTIQHWETLRMKIRSGLYELPGHGDQLQTYPTVFIEQFDS
jgi:hypothetical protein